MPFADEAQVQVKAGGGGNGAKSFRREKFVPLGGPDGGDGGRGGDVIFRGSHDLWELSSIARRQRVAAERGGDGQGARKHGKRGEDQVVAVPLGTEISCEGQVIGDIIRPGQEVVVARGGRGGLGNVHFTTPTRRAPHFAQRGEPGEDKMLDLDLRTLGQVGFVGLPNAGKSSLLAATTAAHPEIAAYPFTTLTPNLGVATVGNVNFVLVDVPGLIEGAHTGLGLGHRFLRHVQRAGVLIQVVDVSEEDPWAGYQAVVSELRLFDETLLDRPRLVALNKIDLEGARDRAQSLQRRLRTEKVESQPVSALTGEGIDVLLKAIQKAVDRALEEEPPPPVKVYRLEAEEPDFTLSREADGFRVYGSRVERIVAMADMDTDGGLGELQRLLERLGVYKALREAGVEEGSTVRVGDFELEWI
ncbi:MAG: GTPase ObgE [Chloroflexi bacterium]|nr:GTPase ObgE [Chloroflexota bacterium]